MTRIGGSNPMNDPSSNVEQKILNNEELTPDETKIVEQQNQELTKTIQILDRTVRKGETDKARERVDDLKKQFESLPPDMKEFMYKRLTDKSGLAEKFEYRLSTVSREKLLKTLNPDHKDPAYRSKVESEKANFEKAQKNLEGKLQQSELQKAFDKRLGGNEIVSQNYPGPVKMPTFDGPETGPGAIKMPKLDGPETGPGAIKMPTPDAGKEAGSEYRPGPVKMPTFEGPETGPGPVKMPKLEGPETGPGPIKMPTFDSDAGPGAVKMPKLEGPETGPGAIKMPKLDGPEQGPGAIKMPTPKGGKEVGSEYRPGPVKMPTFEGPETGPGPVKMPKLEGPETGPGAIKMPTPGADKEVNPQAGIDEEALRKLLKGDKE